MSTLVALLLALVLGASGVAHLRAPRVTAAQLRAHGLRPVGPAAVLVLGSAESVVALWLLRSAPDATAGALPLALAGAFLIGCAAHLARVRARGGSGLPCGCGLGEGGVGGWSVTRAAVLGAVGLLAAAARLEGVATTPVGAAEWIITLTAAATFAVLAAVLPAARPPQEVRRSAGAVPPVATSPTPGGAA